jgi:hypothetical protein
MRPRKRTTIGGQFVPRRIEMLESPAYRVLSLSGHRVLARLEIELGHHGGADNGRLPVTYADFQSYGIERKSIPPAIREVQALGFARVTERGRPSKSDFGRHPNFFELTYIHGAHGEEPTDEWRRHKTLPEAIKVAQHARLNKDENAVGKSKAYSARKSDTREGKIPRTGPESPLQTPSVQPRNPTLQSQVRKAGHQSIFREGVRQHD